MTKDAIFSATSIPAAIPAKAQSKITLSWPVRQGAVFMTPRQDKRSVSLGKPLTIAKVESVEPGRIVLVVDNHAECRALVKATIIGQATLYPLTKDEEVYVGLVEDWLREVSAS